MKKRIIAALVVLTLMTGCATNLSPAGSDAQDKAAFKTEDDSKEELSDSKEEGNGIKADAALFPDELFRKYVTGHFDTDKDGCLSDEEIAAVQTINLRSDEDGKYKDIASVKGIETFTELTKLSVKGTAVTSLDLSGNTKLKYLQCSETDIVAVDTSMLPELANLQLAGTNVQNINLSGNPELQTLDICQTDIKEVDLTAVPKLRQLFCSDCNKLTELVLASNIKLQEVSIQGSGIQTLDLRGLTWLNNVTCDADDEIIGCDKKWISRVEAIAEDGMEADLADDEKDAAKAVPGNGGHFVLFDKKLYFRIPSEKAMNETAANADYESLTMDGSCSIVALDTESMETTELFEDSSKGPIVISGGRLILSETDSTGKEYVEAMSLDGSNREKLPGIRVYASSPSGDLVVTGGIEDDGKMHFYLIDDKGESVEVKSSRELYDYAGLTEDTFYYVTLSEDCDYGSFAGYDLATGKEMIYGDFDAISDFQTAPPVVDQLHTYNACVYLQVSLKKGAYGNYGGCKFYDAQCATENSLRESIPVGQPIYFGDRMMTPAANLSHTINNTGRYMYVEGVTGTAGIDEEGNAGYFAEWGRFVKVTEDYPFNTDGLHDVEEKTQLCELVNNHICIIRNTQAVVPDKDIAWGTAYRRIETSIDYIDTSSKQTVTIARVENPYADADPLKGMVRKDILERFRAENPVVNPWSIHAEALALGTWVQSSIGQDSIPEEIREMGDHIGYGNEYCFGTDIGNNFDNNLPYMYAVYFALKDYYTSGGTRNSDFYYALVDDNDYLGNGDPENIREMYQDLRKLITACNNVLRER
ncbi:leucine-rich repeat domain-containing protein [Butyrivibrio sp. MC2013]|uniref:leucine-rich repeat domain-containing protein n=1 Tax=Butyrivibrio sp. MC2013 TaxID=1280686 RepID=UPI00047C993B|nr:leucine-rich repeat domain-containing protein [Butyrivibrio sp. MC2013]